MYFKALQRNNRQNLPKRHTQYLAKTGSKIKNCNQTAEKPTKKKDFSTS